MEILGRMSSYLSGRSFDCGSGLTEADSSGLRPTSSPSASSDSSASSGGAPMATLNFNAHPSPPFIRPIAPRKDLKLIASHQDAEPRQPPRRPSALFLSQFQEQMSQMKEAMDAVQKEILSDSVPRPRGRPPNSPTYHSQIATSNGLVIKIRKGAAIKSRGKTKGVTKKKRKRMDEDVVYCGEDSEEEEEPKKKRREISQEVEDGSLWGTAIPLNVLRRIMGFVVAMEGSIPFLIRASRVSRLWREATLDPMLWTCVDLSTGKVKDKYRSERNLIYFLENKFSEARTLNLGKKVNMATNSYK